jgi:hypothetical protein
MKKILLVLVIGLLLGAGVATYFLGAPRSRSLPGTPVGPPDGSKETSGTVTVTVDERFFDSLLGTIFQKLGPPQLKLSQNRVELPIQPAAFQTGCSDVIVLNSEAGNVKTGVRFTGGKITAPLAFSGSYSILGKCVQFKGTAKATVNLSFVQDKQIVFGQLDIDEVALDNTPAIISGMVTAFVRRTINEQVNPFEVLRVSQLALALPIRASGGSLKAQVKDVRSEVQEGSLRLYLTYDFSAERDAG